MLKAWASQQGSSGLPLNALAGVWYADQYSATPRPYLPNARLGLAASSDIWSASRRLFNNAAFWNKSGLTITDQAATSYDGTQSASIITNAGTAWSLLSAASSFTAAVANYTVGINVRWRGTGSADFKIGNNFGATQLSTKTATALWARYSFTMTPGIGVGCNPAMVTPDSTSAANFEIDSFEVYPGSTDLGPRPDDGNLYFGLSAFTTAPTLAAGSIDMSSRFGFVPMPTGATVSAFTVMCYGAKQAFNTNYMPILSRAQLYTDFTALFELNDDPILELGTESRQQSGRMMGLAGFHSVGLIYDGTTATVMVDGVAIYAVATASKTFSGQDFLVNTMQVLSNLGKYKYGALAYWTRALSLPEWSRAALALKTHAVAGGVTPVSSTRWMLTLGDSITATVGCYPSLFVPNSSPVICGMNLAVTGYQVSNVAAQLPAIATALGQMNSGDKKIVTVLLGANDLQFTTSNALVDSLFLVPYASLCDSIRALGATLLLGTVLPSTRANVNTSRAYANPILSTWVGTHVDGIFDFAADPTMGPNAAASDTLLYSDGTHPTVLGQTNLEVIFRAAFNAVP